MKKVIWLLLILLNFSCEKKSDTPEVVLDYNKGLLTMIAGNKSFKTEKKYATGTNPPIGYFQLDQYSDGYQGWFYFVTGNFDNLNSCNLFYNLKKGFNSTQLVVNNPEFTYCVINGLKTNATKLIINVTKGFNYQGSYQMYNGTDMLCQGEFSYQ